MVKWGGKGSYMSAKTIIISDKLRAPGYLGIDSYSWGSSRPSIENYEIAILDLNFGEPVPQIGYVSLSGGDTENMHFYELGTEVAKLLKSGGALIALLGPIAVTPRSLSQSYTSKFVSLRQQHCRVEPPSYTGPYETSYDWLEQGFLQTTGIDALFLRPSKGVESTLRGFIERYVRWGERFWSSISGISTPSRSRTEGVIRYPVYQRERWDYPYSAANPQVIILAKGKQTKLPIAVAIRYMDWDGVLILLPPFELEASEGIGLEEETSSLCHTLQDLAQEIKDIFAPRRTADHEEWVYEHRAPRAKEILAEIEELKEGQERLMNKLQPYDEMLSLLDGTDAALVNGVAKLFDKESEGVTVERTDKGAPIDLFIHDKNGRTLVVEVTGIKGYLNKDDPHWADFLGYLPGHYAKNEQSRVERIVLAINTQRKKKLGERDQAGDITQDVRSLIVDNHICVVRTCHLYDLWLETLKGLPIQSVFDKLFNCEGIHEA
jgi:hypothetical protein